MRKIIIIGSPGAGKSTLAKQLSKKTGIRAYHMDRLFWEKGWQGVSRSTLIQKLDKIFLEDSWIIDGNYSSTLDIRMKDADTVIYLDFDVLPCVAGVLDRRIRYHGRTRPDMGKGCKEKLDWEFLWFVLSFRHRNRRNIYSKLRDYRGRKRIIILSNRQQIEGFLKAFH